MKGTTRFKVERGSHSILEVISDIFEGKPISSKVPYCIRSIERVNVETVRINFIDEVDEDLLIRIALKEGFRVERGSFAPRIVEKDAIVARIGSRSDFGGRFDLYIYPFPPEIERLSMYRRVLASRRGLINSKTGRANLEKIHEFNLRIIRLVNSYIKEKYF